MHPLSVAALCVAAALGLGRLVLANPVETCTDTNICMRIAVPESSAKSGSGNIYFQIEGPSSYSWIALGQGDQMANSNMFIMYQDGAGNVTVSPRKGTNHVMPQEDTSSTKAQLTLLAGSGTVSGTMRANVMCSNCQSWSGGAMSLSSTSSSWIAAWKSGNSLATTDKNAQLQRHDQTDIFSIDLTQATITSDTNPFVSSSNSSSGSNTSGGGASNNNNGTTDSGASNGVTQTTNYQDLARLITAHGVIMSIVFVILYPFGSILMPLTGRWMIHASWQIFSFVLMWAGFGLGIVASRRTSINFTATHTVFGTVIVCLMILQPVLGWLHHARFAKYQTRDAVLSPAHVWYGRVLMLLGVVNGGLGLQLAGAGDNFVTAYSVLAAVLGVVYVGVKGVTSVQRRRGGGGGGDDGSHGAGPRSRRHRMSLGSSGGRDKGAAAEEVEMRRTARPSA